MQNCVFSAYGISIQYPPNWGICFDVKNGVGYKNGFVRIEDFIPRKGAQISMSLQWSETLSNSQDFAEQCIQNIEGQYKSRLKKQEVFIRSKELIEFCSIPAAFIETEYVGKIRMFSSKNNQPVYIMHMGFYHEASSRAVVVSVIGVPEIIKEKKDFLRQLMFSVNCTGDKFEDGIKCTA